MAIFGTQTRQPFETHPGPEQLKHHSGCRVIRDGDPTHHKDLPTGRGVGHFHRFQFKALPFDRSKALPFGLSKAPLEFTVVAKEVKLMALQRGIRIHQYLDDWLMRAASPSTVSSIHRHWYVCVRT